MKAIRIHEHGGLDQLKLDEVKTPKPQTNEVLIRVKACALNHLDIWVREGMPGVKIPLPHTPGCDVAGIIEAVGPGVVYQKGDEVILSPGTSCGVCWACTSGHENLCRHYGVIGETSNGGYAQYLCVSQDNVLPKPKNLSFEEAAAMPLVFLTAWHMLVHHGKLAPGHWVLIHAAGSGIGSAAIQIGKLFNAQMIATAGSQEKLNRARDLGAQHLINYQKEDFLKRVREITQKRGVDIVFEHTGKSTFEASYKSLCRGGCLITCGATTGWNVSIDLRYVFSKHLKILGSTMGTKSELMEVMAWAEKGVFKPVIDRTFPLHEAAKAQDYLNSRRHFGKVLLIP